MSKVLVRRIKNFWASDASEVKIYVSVICVLIFLIAVQLFTGKSDIEVFTEARSEVYTKEIRCIEITTTDGKIITWENIHSYMDGHTSLEVTFDNLFSSNKVVYKQEHIKSFRAFPKVRKVNASDIRKRR